MITGLLWPAFGGQAVLAGPAVLTIYGPEWTGGGSFAFTAVDRGVIGTSITMLHEIFLVSGKTDRLLQLEPKRNAVGLTSFTLGCLVWAAAARVW